jgi:hypothetical protein
VHAGGEAMAGAKAGLDLTGSRNGIGGEVGAEGWAGVGIAGDLDIGFEDGKFTFEANGGAALGLGGKLSGGLTVDPDEVWESSKELVSDIGDLFG